MGKLQMPTKITVKEIIRYDETRYLLSAEVELNGDWEKEVKTLFIRTDIHGLSELLRLENTKQSKKIEDIFISMLTIGEPPRTDIKELTGSYLSIRKANIIFKEIIKEGEEESIHHLPILMDVFPKIKTKCLTSLLQLENEFSKDILVNTFENFQTMFALIDRGYTVQEASALTYTNNPISAMIYNKIKRELSVEIPQNEKKEERIEENFSREKQLIM